MSTDTATRTRPILFSSEMVKAILDGRKSMTRRAVKPQPAASLIYRGPYEHAPSGRCGVAWRDTETIGGGTGVLPVLCPYGRPGDRLVLLCNWAAPKQYDKVKPSKLPRGVRIWSLFDGETKPEWAGRTRPGRFMPKWLRECMPKADVTDVRVERLQEITEGDAAREGFWPHKYRPGFQETWDKLNAKRGFGWESNPWVWVVSFERVEP